MLLDEAAKAGVQPVIGMRAKLATRHGGHWGTTSGENAKFGLSPCDMVAVMRKLAAAGMAHCLQLLHFHIGSQVGILHCYINNYFVEHSTHYAQLSNGQREVKKCCKYLDVS